MSPTERTLAALRKLGFTAQVVERWNPHARVRQDLFGCIDIVAMHPNYCAILGVQACSAASMSARRSKAEAEERLLSWLQSGGRFEVWAWKGPLLRRDSLVSSATGWDWHEGEYETVAEMLACAV